MILYQYSITSDQQDVKVPRNVIGFFTSRFEIAPDRGIVERNLETLKLYLMFKVFEEDGLVTIKQKRDHDALFENVIGDSFKPEFNIDIPAKRLEMDRKAEFSRFKSQGCFGYGIEFHEKLNVDSDYIWGFIGTDYLGSDYDREHYDLASTVIHQKYNDYYNSVLNDIDKLVTVDFAMSLLEGLVSMGNWSYKFNPSL